MARANRYAIGGGDLPLRAPIHLRGERWGAAVLGKDPDAVGRERPLPFTPRPSRVPRRGARVVESGGLENRCRPSVDRGFESHPLR